MAKVTIAHHPELTPDSAMELFRNHFGEKYEVYKVRKVLRHFCVKKSGAVGVGVRLQQGGDETALIYSAHVPSFLLNMFGANMWGLLFFLSSWKALEREVREFVENAPEFK